VRVRCFLLRPESNRGCLPEGKDVSYYFAKLHDPTGVSGLLEAVADIQTFSTGVIRRRT